MTESKPKGKIDAIARTVGGAVEDGVANVRNGIADGLEEVTGEIDAIVDGVKDDIQDIKEDIGELRDEIRGEVDEATAAVKRIEESCAQAAKQNKRFPKVIKVFAILLIVTGVLHCAGYLFTMVTAALAVYEGNLSEVLATMDSRTAMSAAFGVTLFVLVLASSVISIALGVRLLRDHRARVARYANALMLIEAASLTVSSMLYGISSATLVSLAYVIFLGLLSVYADPTLRRERLAKRRALQLEEKEEQEAGVLGLDKTGKGYIELNFFNLFWIFVVCCFLGLVIETVYHMTVIDWGVYQDRAGLLYGPFSPIYGVGGVLITIVLNRFHKSNPFVVFLAAAFIGASFEYLVSWWMETSFGITAWDYTGTFLNVGGRTNFVFFCMWGCLGIVWLRWILPRLLALINRIPWKWRYSLTTAAAALMLVNCVLTVAALDCWYSRQAGLSDPAAESALERFCDRNYGDEYMQERFQTMSIDTGNATRIS